MLVVSVSEYVPLPKFYTFESRDERERILYKNFLNVGQEVKVRPVPLLLFSLIVV
jgi:hypothetical protein